MLQAAPLVAPTLPVPQRRPPPLFGRWMGACNNLSTWPREAFEAPVWRSRFFGADALVVSDPAGARHALNEAAKKYRRISWPAIASPSSTTSLCRQLKRR